MVWATCAAGSVVERWTGCPRRASSTAIAAAIVVLPTPPLPIVMIRPWPGAASSSTSVSRRCVPSGAGGASAAGASGVGALLSKTRASASTPSGANGSSGIVVRASAPSAEGMLWRAWRWRSSSASASVSLRSLAWKTPLSASRWFSMPSSASSPRLRSASASAEGSGRLTSTIVVRAGSVSAANVASYSERCDSRPASGPRQEVPVVFVAMNSLHALGSRSSRSVWPVGAVSKITWSKPAVASGEPSSRANSSKAAISTVQAPESCSSMLATAVAGSRSR